MICDRPPSDLSVLSTRGEKASFDLPAKLAPRRDTSPPPCGFRALKFHLNSGVPQIVTAQPAGNRLFSPQNPADFSRPGSGA